MKKKIFLLCKIFAKFLQILNLHTDFRPREESVIIVLCKIIYGFLFGLNSLVKITFKILHTKQQINYTICFSSQKLMTYYDVA